MPLPNKWLVTGASGLLGSVVVSRLLERGARVCAQQHKHALPFDGSCKIVTGDLTDLEWARELVIEEAPDVIVHCAGLTSVDGCEANSDLAELIHVDASQSLAEASGQAGARFLHISTDHLWRGDKAMVSEDEPVEPINVYGRTKAQGEQRVLDAHPEALVVRTNFFCRGHPWRPSFSDWAEQKLRSGARFNAFVDSFFTPIEATLLSDFLIELAASDATGILHVAGRERVSKYDFVAHLAARLSLDSSGIEAGRIANARLAAPRPRDMSLATEKAAALLGRAMPSLNDSLDSLLQSNSLVA